MEKDKKMSIACVTVVKNEEKNIIRALESVVDWIDEIVVVDMQSQDSTVKIASNFTKKIYSYPDVGYVEPARNFSLAKASSDWILVLDADEVIPKTLAVKLQELAETEETQYFRLPRKNIIFGKWIRHSRWWPDYNIRFFKKGAVSWSERIHAVPETHGEGFDLPASEDNAIIHYHYTSLEQYLARMNVYTTEHAKLLIKEGVQFSWQDAVKKPADEFLGRYFFGQGYKDGIHGLAIAGLQAFSELVLYLKVWQRQKFAEKKIPIRQVVRQMRKIEKEFHYWQADTLLREKGGIIERVRRKLRL